MKRPDMQLLPPPRLLGLGLIIVDGRYYALPSRAIEYLAQLDHDETMRRAQTELEKLK